GPGLAAGGRSPVEAAGTATPAGAGRCPRPGVGPEGPAGRAARAARAAAAAWSGRKPGRRYARRSREGAAHRPPLRRGVKKTPARPPAPPPTPRLVLGETTETGPRRASKGAGDGLRRDRRDPQGEPQQVRSGPRH